MIDGSIESARISNRSNRGPGFVDSSPSGGGAGEAQKIRLELRVLNSSLIFLASPRPPGGGAGEAQKIRLELRTFGLEGP